MAAVTAALFTKASWSKPSCPSSGRTPHGTTMLSGGMALR